MSDITFGDHVRIRPTPLTIEQGIAGRLGQVYGHSTPSVTGVEVVGADDTDLAFNIHFEDPESDLWLAPHLLEFVDHAAGTEIRIGDVAMTRGPSGEWIKTEETGERKRRWWKRR